MGLVYRADDLQLGQTVALKILAPGFSGAVERMDALRTEVRNARWVTHPNVCRVHDLGETQGQPFLSMEFVDGEDLASLLRRIGSLAPDKALEIAHQLCAGLAAAHEHGVIHRDLKPANVMIDGRGQAKITDFGLALGPTDAVRGGEIAGTLAYMAPEQKAGAAATIQSDIYSLGLILYELFTGQPAFPAAASAAPRTRVCVVPPSRYVSGLETAVENAILSSLDEDPSARPGSAAVLASLLPGGSALALAVAAGATPRPEVVVAAGSGSGLGSGACWAALSVFVASSALCVLLTPRFGIVGRAQLTKSPEVLAEKAREIAIAAGYAENARDEAWYFTTVPDAIGVLIPESSGQQIQPLLWFNFRRSPEVMVPANPLRQLSDSLPPLVIPGMVNIRLSTEGRLLRLAAVGTQPGAGNEPIEPDWSPLFSAAGLTLAEFRPEAPSGSPRTPFDLRRSWRDGTGGTRVEAASLGGRPVSFDVVPGLQANAPESQSSNPESSGSYHAIMTLVCLALAAFLARRNWRLGRCDERAALRLAMVVGLCRFAQTVLSSSHHYGSTSDFFSWFRAATGSAAFSAGFLGLQYLALEPYTRRHWPRLLLGWSRLIGGSLRDRRVGTELLVGTAAGAATGALSLLVRLLVERLGVCAIVPMVSDTASLMGLRYGLGRLCDDSIWQAFMTLLATTVLAVGYAVTRNRVLAAATGILLLIGYDYTVSALWSRSSLGTLLIVLSISLFFVILMKLGTLAAFVCLFTRASLSEMALGSGGWATPVAVLPLVLAIGLALFGFWTAQGGRTLVPRLLDDED